MPRFDLNDYIEVKDRIALFWEKYPEGAITTELLHADDHIVRVHAKVYAGRAPMQIPLGTGLAEEVRIPESEIKKNPKLANNPNAGSAVENCETSAVGRALANAGFGVSKAVASRQEMEKVQRMHDRRETSEKALDKPKEPAKVSSNGAEPKLSEDEARTLARSVKKTGMETSALLLKLTAMGFEPKTSLATTLQQLSKDEAQEFFSWVKGETSEEN